MLPAAGVSSVFAQGVASTPAMIEAALSAGGTVAGFGLAAGVWAGGRRAAWRPAWLRATWECPAATLCERHAVRPERLRRRAVEQARCERRASFAAARAPECPAECATGPVGCATGPVATLAIGVSRWTGRAALASLMKPAQAQASSAAAPTRSLKRRARRCW